MKGEKGFQTQDKHWNWKGGKIIGECIKCGEKTVSSPSRIRKYCSQICYQQHHIGSWKGKKRSLEARQKMSLAKIGKPTGRAGIPLPAMQGEKHPNWKGGKSKSENGYILLRVKHPNSVNGYYYEHRLVIERELGRFLEPSEIVHHKNGDKTDNKIANLEVMSRAEHAKHHKTPQQVTNSPN